MTPAALSPAKFCKALACVLIALFAAAVSRAQFTYSEDFKNDTAPGWVLNPPGNSSTGVVLTSGAAVRSGDPEASTSSTIDPSGSGWLRLTNNTTNLSNAVYFDTPIPSAGNSVTIQFGVNLFNGNNFNNTGADGLTFFLYDASKAFQVGAYGGSIGYAQKTGVDGLNGGFVAVALDAYGNFSLQAEGRQGGVQNADGSYSTTLQANTIAIRGPGQGQTGYNYLAGTGYRDLTDTGSPTTLDAADGTVPSLPYTMAFPTATARPNQSTQYRNVSITLNENSQLSVSMQFGEDGLWYNLLNVDLSSFVRPEQLKMGFSAGTGDGSIVTEVGGLLRIDATAGSGNFIWDNGEGSSLKIWGTGANDPLNWSGNTNPTLKSNVIFNSTYISSAQSIDVTGSDKVITNLYFSGANSYTLSSSESRKLIFDTSSGTGLTAINLTNDVNGNAAHTINLDIQANQALDINNNISPTFTINGNVDNGGNNLGLKGTGTTVITGAISGAGNLTKSDSGTTILNGSGVNTYTGNTVVNGGTLQIEKASALGSTAGDTTVNAGATLALGGTGTTFAAENLTISGDGVNSAGALHNVAGINTWTGNVALAGTGSNTIGVDSGTGLTINGTVSGASGDNLTKTGAGTLYLAGNNTYSGTTTINSGVLQIQSDSGLGTAPGAATPGDLTLNGGTLATGTTMTLSSNRGIALGSATSSAISVSSGATMTYGGVIAGSGNLGKIGAGTLVLSGAETYTGATSVLGGTLQLGANNVFSGASTPTALTVSSGSTFDVNSHTDTVGSVFGSGTISLGTGSLTSGADNTSTNFSGVISGGSTSSFTKSGTGTLTLSGIDTTSGNVTVSGGVLNLQATGAGALGSVSNIIVKSGATLQLGAANQINDGANLILSGGTFSPNGFNENMHQLSSNSTTSGIDYLNLSSTLKFGTVSATAGLGSITNITISNWAGNTLGGGVDQLVVYSTTAPNVSNITFSDWGSATTVSLGNNTYEIVPAVSGNYWNINGSGNWSNGNWLGTGNSTNAPNAQGRIAILGDTGTAHTTALTTNPVITITSGTTDTVGKLIFENSGNKSYTINPASSTSTLALDVASGNAQVIVNDNGAHVINTKVTIADPTIVTVGSNATAGLTFSNTTTMNLTAAGNLTVNGPGNTVFSGAIVQGNKTVNVLKTDTGNLTLSGTNTYNGTTTIEGGNIVVGANAPSGANGALGNSTASIVINDANTLSTSDTGLVIGTGSVSIGRTITVNSGANSTTLGGSTGLTSGVGTFNNTITLNQNVFLNASGTSTITFSGQIAENAGGAIEKTGSGTVVLSGGTANTGNGTVTVDAGTLQIAKTVADGGMGTNSSVTVNSGGTLQFAGGVNQTIGSLAGAGTVDSSGASMTLTTGGANTSTTFSGTITDTANSLSLTKVGTGNLTLSGSNTYSGTTTISGGTLTMQNANALGNSGAATSTVVNGGATLAIDLAGTNTIANETLTLGNTTSGGILKSVNAAGNNTWTGGIVLGNSSSTILTTAGNLTIGTTAITGTGLGLTVDGAGNTTLNSALNTGTGGTLTKNGTGTLTLAALGNYTGATNINAGTVMLTNVGGLGTATGGTTVANGATLNFAGSSYVNSEAFTVSGAGASGTTGALVNSGADHTLTGGITFNSETTIGVASGTNLTASGSIGGAFGLIKADTGTLILSASNTYTGTTAINAGVLELTGNGALGSTAGPTTISSGASLALVSLNSAVAENITAAGSGVGGAGAIQNQAGNNTISGNLSFTGDTTIGVSGGNLTVSGNIGVSNGSYGLIKTGSGNLTLSGSANSYTGNTTVSNGALIVTSNAPVSANGSLGNSGSTVQIGDSNTAASNNLGLFINNATGGLSIDRSISINNFNTSGTTTLGGTNTSGTDTFTGGIGLARDVTISEAASGGTVALSGTISGSGGIIKTGAGTAVLSGNNTYNGNTTVSGGSLVIASNNALGSSAGSTSVTSGATLGLQGNVSVPSGQALTLNGAGVSSVGALDNISGNNTYAGNVSLGSASTIGVTNAGDTLTMSGVISGAQNLTTTGAGTLNLTGQNTVSGSLTLNGSSGSAVVLNNAVAALANIASISVNAGNSLIFAAAGQINGAADLTLNGGTLNVASFSQSMHSLTLASNSTIDFSGDGSILKFNGTVGTTAGLTLAGKTLTIADWSGSLTGSGSEQLIVYSPSGAPSVSTVTFTGWGGATTVARPDLGSGYYEIVPTTGASTFTWAVNGNGNWSTTSSWASGTVPNSNTAVAVLGSVNNTLSVNPTVALGATNETVNKLIFDTGSNKNYTISSTGGALTFAGTSPQIIVNDNGSHAINAPVNYSAATTITDSSSATAGLTLGNTQTTSFTGNLTFDGAGNTVVTGPIKQSSGTAGVDKVGTGTLTLGNATSNYTGATTVANGTLIISANAPSGANGALGNSTGNVVINDSSATSSSMDTSLLIGATGVTVGRNIQVNPTGNSTTIGGSFTSGSSTFSGNVTINKTVDLTAAGTSTVTFNGVITDGASTANVTKDGTGTVVLGNATNSYDGSTTINAGTLTLGVAGAIPNNSAVTVASGATFDLGNFSETIGSLAGAGTVNLSGSANNTLTTGGNNGSTTFSGTINDTGTGLLSLVKTGTGTMTLSGANTYAGNTTVSGGTLIAANNSALGLTGTSTTVAAGASLGLQGGITISGDPLTLNTTNSSPSTPSLENVSGTNVWTGVVTLNATTANNAVGIDAAGGSQLTISGNIGQGTNAAVLSKTGTGTLVLSGNNTYTGNTNVAGGTLIAASNNALGTTAAGTTVQIGATLGVQGNVTIASGESISLAGTASPSSPSLKNFQDTNTVAGNITLTGTNNTGVAIDSNSGSLTLNGTISQATNANFVTKTGSGSLTLSGSAANTFSGGFNVNDGTVIAAKTAGVDATGSGSVTIGDGVGSAGSAVLQLNASNQINNGSSVTVNTDGQLNLGANSDTINALTMGGGSVIGSGTLQLSNNLTFNGVGTAQASISANLDLGTANLTSGSRIVQVGNNGQSGDVDLSISGAIAGGTTGFTKTDLGTLQLSGSTANTFSGDFKVNDGTVLLNKTAGVNATGTGNVTVGDGAGAAGSAVVRLSQSNQINDTSTVTINSDGKFDLNGLNEKIGGIAGTGTISTGSGTLTISNTNGSSSFSGTIDVPLTGKLVLDVDSDHNGTVFSPSGTFTFASSETFAGELDLQSGTIILGTGVDLSVGTLHITGNTILDFGNSAATQLNAGNLIVDAGASLTIKNWVSGTDFFYTTLWGGANAPNLGDRGVGQETSITFNGFSSSSTAWMSNDHQITPAPEPATYGAIFMGGALGLFGWRRWRKAKAEKAAAGKAESV